MNQVVRSRFKKFLLLSTICTVIAPLQEAGALEIGKGESVSGNYLAARFARQQNNLHAASRFMDRVIEQGHPQSELTRKAMTLALAEGKVDQALPLAERYLQENPESVVANLVLASQAVKNKQFGEAATRLDSLELYGNYTVMVPLAQAWIQAGEGDYTRALQTISMVEQQYNETRFNHLLHYHRALIMELAEAHGSHIGEQTEKHYLAAVIDAGSPNYRIYQALGSYLERTGNLDEALKYYKRYESEIHDSILTDAYKQRRASDQVAEPVVKNAVEGLAEVFLTTAELIGRGNERDDVLATLNLSLYLRPAFALAQFRLGRVFETNGMEHLAVQAYEKVDENSPLHWLARVRAAVALAENGRVEEARERLHKMTGENGEKYDVYLQLGWLARMESDFDEAIEMYSAALDRIEEVQAHHWPLFYYRGASYEREKEWEKAEADFMKALELEPGQPDVLNYLGYSWLVIDKNLEQAKEYIEGAVLARPNDPHIIDSVGWAYFKLKDYQTAIDYLERASEMMPYDSTVNDHLGDVYWHLGRRNEARFQWKRALHFDPEPEVRDAIENKLKHGISTMANLETAGDKAEALD